MDIPLSELEELERRLRQRRGELLAEIEAHRSERPSAGEASGEVADQKDEASQLQYSAVLRAEDQRDVAELRSIDTALHRLGEGRYGTCIDCGEPIGLQRLLAQPDALRCAACQSAHERRRH